MKKYGILCFVMATATVFLAACSLSTTAPASAPTAEPGATGEQTGADRTATRPAPTVAPSTTATGYVTATFVPSRTPEPPTPTPSVTATPPATATPATVVFAAIGDYGLAGEGAAGVAALVDSWEPEFIITLGDNNYPDGEAQTIDENVGQYYAEYIYPYHGAYTTTVSTPDVNRFFPALGNHDYYGPDGPQPYLDYFTLPGNERYYDFVWGPVHLFALNSDFNEPDGIRAESAQAQWLQEELAASAARWKLVYFHAAPYTSGTQGSSAWMRWPFQEWGASAVLAGHDHHYERLLVGDLVYFVNGLGGGAIYAVEEALPSSQVRFTGAHGAMRIEASAEAITFEFITRAGEVVDSYTLTK